MSEFNYFSNRYQSGVVHANSTRREVAEMEDIIRLEAKAACSDCNSDQICPIRDKCAGPLAVAWVTAQDSQNAKKEGEKDE